LQRDAPRQLDRALSSPRTLLSRLQAGHAGFGIVRSRIDLLSPGTLRAAAASPPPASWLLPSSSLLPRRLVVVRFLPFWQAGCLIVHVPGRSGVARRARLVSTGVQPRSHFTRTPRSRGATFSLGPSPRPDAKTAVGAAEDGPRGFDRLGSSTFKALDFLFTCRSASDSDFYAACSPRARFSIT